PDKYQNDALKLAIQLNNYDYQRKLLAYQLKKSPNSKQLLIQYTDAIQNQGYPLEALKILQGIPGVEKDKDYLDKLIFLSRGLDNPSLLLHYLELANKFNTKSTDPSVKLAQYFYLKGDLQ